MILFFAPGGRIGNLLFQWAFIESIRKLKEWVLATQLKDFPTKAGFPRRLLFSNSRFLINIIDYLIYPLVYHIAIRCKLISSYLEEKEKVVFRKGLFPITYIGGYFQKGSAALPFSVQAVLNGRALATIDPVLHAAKGKKKVFIHVRRTDYKDFSVNGTDPVILPKEYYQDALRRYFPDLESSYFYIVGDDPTWAYEVFEHLPHAFISKMKPWEDLHLMSQCDGGIISNSTFAWWGAYFCKRSDVVVAPRFWLGWYTKQWWPKQIQTPWLEYLDVPREA